MSEDLLHLERGDDMRSAREELEALLIQGLRGGEPTEMTRQDWEDIRCEALMQFEARKSNRSA